MMSSPPFHTGQTTSHFSPWSACTCWAPKELNRYNAFNFDQIIKIRIIILKIITVIVKTCRIDTYEVFIPDFVLPRRRNSSLANIAVSIIR